MAGVPAMNTSGLSGVDFGQRLSLSEQEQFQASPDLYDNSVNSQYLEVYMHYAAIERKREAADNRPIPDSTFTVMFKTATFRRSKIVWGSEQEPPPPLAEEGTLESASASDTEGKMEKQRVGSLSRDNGEPIMVSQDERDRLYRALRVASWQAVFYLITTDILGWSAASKSFSDLGYGPGILVYFFFYLLAIFAGQVIWKLYLSLDSSRYPVVCYADLGERTFGRFVRHIFNVFQSLQLVFNVALIINGNASTLAELALWNKHTCFLGMCAVWFGVGFLGGQIRSLKNFAWLCNWNIWINIITMIMTIYGCAHYAPVPSLSYHKTLGPIEKSGWVPPADAASWYLQVQGVQFAVFAYGGAMIFPEFMAEMRRPRDFWKSAACAQFFCFACYMTFGIVTYYFQGDYASILPTLDFQNYPLIIGVNSLSLFSSIVAAVLYGNIGCKVFYENVLRTYFKVPSMLSKSGRLIFGVTVFIYWGVAWVIATGVPALSALETLVGAMFILQFTYTFPPILAAGFWIQVDAMKGDRPWEPGMIPGSNRVDTWRDKSRWARGFKRYWYVKSFLVLMFIAAIANCALGVYAGVETAISTFGPKATNPVGSFKCASPLYPYEPGHRPPGFNVFNT